MLRHTIVLIVGIFLIVSYTIAYPITEKRLRAEWKTIVMFHNAVLQQAEIKADLDAGLNMIKLSGLPADLDESKISCQVLAEGISIISTQYINKNPSSSKELRQVEDSLARLDFEFDSLQNLLKTYEKEEAMILHNKNLAGANTTFKIHEIEDLADFYEERFAYLHRMRYKAMRRMETLQLQLFQTRLRWQKVKQQAKNNHTEFYITLISNTKGVYPLEINVAHGFGGWKPVFELHSVAKEEKMYLITKAKLWQQTAMLWDKANIKLVDAPWNEALTLPTLPKTRLDVVDAYIAMRSEIAAKTMKKTPDAIEETMQSIDATSTLYTETSSTSFSQPILSNVYEISFPLPLRGDSSVHTIEISRIPYKPRYKYILYPSQNEMAYLTAVLSGDAIYTLRDQNVPLFLQGNYIGNAFIKLESITDSVEIPLYLEPKVRARKEVLTDFKSQKVVGINIKQEVGYQILVKNDIGKQIRCTVLENIPVSVNSLVELEVLPDPFQQLDMQRGEARWELNLQAGESKTLNLKYNIKYPKGKQLIYR